jgi:hypothetical protein
MTRATAVTPLEFAQRSLGTADGIGSRCEINGLIGGVVARLGQPLT